VAPQGEAGAQGDYVAAGGLRQCVLPFCRPNKLPATLTPVPSPHPKSLTHAAQVP
jgi:hypothetical protein